MPRRSLPKNLGLHLPAYHTVIYQGVPMFRAQAWALEDYFLHGGHGGVNSGIRKDEIVKSWRLRGLRVNYSSQKELYQKWLDYSRKYGALGAQARGVFPANPPGYSTHEGWADGVATFHRKNGNIAKRGEPIVEFEWGIDFVDKAGGSAATLVAWLNAHGYKAERPYRAESERHHFCFRKSPVTRARMRLARWLATGK